MARRKRSKGKSKWLDCGKCGDTCRVDEDTAVVTCGSCTVRMEPPPEKEVNAAEQKRATKLSAAAKKAWETRRARAA
jgi:hypothetical protein